VTLTAHKTTVTAGPTIGAMSPHGQPPVGRWKQWSASHPAWPLTALLAGYPIWWALGLADLIFIFAAIPMVVRMYAWQRRGRRVKIPPGFGLWLGFLVVMLAGFFTLSLTAPGTVVSPVSNRLVSFGVRSVSCLALTVLLLFAGNLTEQECSRRRLAWLLGLVGIYAVVGGVGGLVDPHFQFTSPLAYMLPKSATQNSLIQSWVHPGLSQIQSVLGSPAGRPKAPFDYTNIWGDCLTILLPWLFVAWSATRRQRWLALSIAVVALVPIVYSLNRGVWIGLVFAVIYLAVRFAARGRLALLGVVCAALAAVVVLFLATPLHNIVSERLQHQNSNSIRSTLDVLSVRDALASPLIGYGDTRHMLGTPQSIALGPSPNCLNCGELEVGSTGQLWQMFIDDGFLGAALFFGFFAYGAWRYRRDTTPYGIAGVLVLLLSFVYSIAYSSISEPLAFTMLAYALLWRNDEWLRGGRTAAAAGVPGRAARASVAHRPFAYRAPAAASAYAASRSLSVTYKGRHRPVIDTAPAQPVIDTKRSQRVDGRLAEVARGGLFNLIGAGVAGLSTVAVTLIVARSFSQAAAGAFFATTSLFLIVAAVTSLGAGTGTVYFIARLRSTGQDRRIPEVFRAAIPAVAVVSCTIAAVLALVAPALGRVLVHGEFGHAGARPDQVAVALRALAVALPFAALLDTFLGATRGFRAMGPTNAVDRIGRTTVQLAGIAVVAAAGNAALLAPVWALPYVVAACAAWLWLRAIRRRSLPGEVPVTAGSPAVRQPGQTAMAQPNEPLRFWRFTVPRGLAVLAQVTIQRIDIVLVAIMRGPAEAAIYTAATRFLVAGQFANQAISMAAQPRFTEMFALRDLRGANRVYQATTAWLVLLTWPFFLLAVFFGPQILTVFGHSYRAGDTVLVILSLSMLLATACGQVDMVLVTTGRSSWSLVNGLLAVVINVGLDLLLIPRYGITGAAIGWAAAIAVTNLMPLAQLMVTVRLHPLGRGTLIAIALSCLSFGLLPLAIRGLFGHGAVPSLAAIACGCAIMAAGMWRFRADLYLAAWPGAARLMAVLGGSTPATDRKRRATGIWA
jgi:O-antigen/teichoic acid export membrane protein